MGVVSRSVQSKREGSEFENRLGIDWRVTDELIKERVLWGDSEEFI